MKKHKRDFRIISTKKCIDCNELIKQNLVDRNPNVNRCYCCHNLSKGITKRDKKRYNKMEGTFDFYRTIDYIKLQSKRRKQNNWRK